MNIFQDPRKNFSAKQPTAGAKQAQRSQGHSTNPPAQQSSSESTQNSGQRLQKYEKDAKQKGQPQPSTSGQQTEKPKSERQNLMNVTGEGKQSPSQKLPEKHTEIVAKGGLLEIKVKEPGKKGRDLGVIDVNYLEVSLKNVPNYIYHYDLTIEPERPKKLLRLAFSEFKRENFDGITIIFDGRKNAFSVQPLKLDKLKEEIMIIHPETEKERKYTVSIQEANNCRVPLEHILKT